MTAVTHRNVPAADLYRGRAPGEIEMFALSDDEALARMRTLDPDAGSCLHLWIAVMRRMAADAVLTGPNHGMGVAASGWRVYRDRGVVWFRRSDFKAICSMLDLDPDKTRECLLADARRAGR